MTLHLTEEQAARLTGEAPKRKRTAKPKALICTGCGEMFTGMRKDAPHCPECRARRKKELGHEWHIKNYQPKTERPLRAPYLSDPADLSDQARSRLTWYDNGPPNLLWNIAIAIPYTSHFSKNKLLGRTRSGVYMRQEARAAQETIAEYFVAALHQAERTVVRAKLWLDIFVQKPNHYSDAVNLVDTICDALKVATGLDDRWFSIRRLDWEVVTDEPYVFIGIGQDTDEEHGICEFCKRLLPLSVFRKSNSPSRTDGTTGRCIDCRIPKKR